MSAAQHYQHHALLNVAGVESELTLTVHYIVSPEFAGTWDQPAEPREIEILSIWHLEHVLHHKMLTEEQYAWLEEEILSATATMIS